MTSSQFRPIKVCMLVFQHPFLDARIFKREAKSLVKLGYDVTMVVPRNKDGLMYDIDGTPFTDEFLEPVFYHEGVRIVPYKARMPHYDHMEKALSSMDEQFSSTMIPCTGKAWNKKRISITLMNFIHCIRELALNELCKQQPANRLSLSMTAMKLLKARKSRL